MSTIFAFLFLFSVIGLIVGLITPKAITKLTRITLPRKKIALLFGGLSLLSMILVGVTTDPSTRVQSNQAKNEATVIDQTAQATNSSNPQNSPSPISTQAPADKPNDSTKTVKVTRVIDGDTIEIEGGQRVRYIGIDTPETVDPRTTVQCFGKEASDKNKELVGNKEVRLEKDVSETDKYGRLLRYVYVGDTFINDYLVRQGYARSSSYPPDIKYQGQFRQAEQEARGAQKGLWGSTCQPSPTPQAPQTQSSQTTGTTGTSTAPQTQSGSCVIKGNISSSGERIYHMPGQNFYNKTVIDTSKGERWFCSEAEAQTAGWRKAKV